MINARNKRFDSNRKALENEDFEMRYPANLEPYPHHLREVFKHMQQTISADDLMALQEGQTSDECIINVYFKILEKINMVLLRAQDFLRSIVTKDANTTPQDFEVATQTVLYCNTSFIRDFKNCVPNDYESLMNGPETDQKRRFAKILKDVAEHDVVLIPFYPEINNPNESDQTQTAMLVELKPRSYQATLYTQAGNRLSQTTNGEGTPNPTE